MDGCDCIKPLWQADDLLMKYQSISDFFIAVACFSVPLELIYFVQKSAFFPYRWVLIQFGASIFLCGATHLINMWTFTTHTKTIAVVLTAAKVAKAVLSCTTALMLVHIIPDLLSVKLREWFLKAKVEELDREVRIIERRQETEWHVHMLTHEIRSTLDRHTILKTTLVEMGRKLGLAECAVWMPSRSGTTLQLSHALHSSAPLGSVVPINLPIVATIFNSNCAERIPHTSPLASVKTQKSKYVPPEVVAVRVPLLQLTNFQKNDWPELSAKAFAVMVLMLPPDSAREWQPHELELVEVVADQVAVALSHAAILEESMRARDLLTEQNIALSAARREAELAICARNDFLAVKNHEMRTPMRAIISLSSLLLETKLTAEQRVMIETILKSSDLLRTPANDVLDISKLGDGSLELEIAPFNLHATFTDGEMSSTLGIIEFPTSSSLGAMGPLLRKFDLLLDSKNQLIRRSAKEAIKLLKEDLEEINADLVELSMVERPNYKTRYWMQEVRELSYHIEDCIDNMVQSRAAAEGKVRFSGRRPQLRVRRRVKIPWLPKTVKPSASIADLRTLLWEARERHERYQLQDCVSSEPRFMFSGNSRAPASSLSLSGAAANNLVGVDGTRGKLTSWLIDEQMEAEQEQLKVLSILGPEGVGKTALAKELYCQLGHQFECRAFVRVSWDPNMRRLLGEILAQVQGRKRDYEYEAASTADNLMDSIRSHLQDKRYFVVIDELWDAAAWDIMNIAFPKGNNCSRIIITAEGKDVASKCYCVNKLEMAPLGNLQDSGKIFFDRVFGSEHQCPDQLMDISCMIIRSCGGFPLAITTIASLLASQRDNTELWDYLQKCFVSRLTGVTLEETCKEVVNFCYDALPQDLKTCLLYLTMYPQGSTIRKVDLLNQWIAEGFITPKEENQTVAESYFAELINRGMIQPEKVDHNDEVLSCTVHHIVFDLIAQKSREENFITTVDYSQAMPGLSMIARRLSLHFSCAQFASKPEGMNLSQVRSLAFYGFLKCMPSITKFKFLRVLILEFWGDNYHPNTSLDLSKLSILFHLRYLKVSSHIVIVLPSQIRRLQSLETLEIDAQVSAVPTGILHLPILLHLSLANGTELPDGIGRITSLQTLEHFDLGSNSEDNAQSLGELINLQNLHVTCSKAVSDHHLKRNLVALSSSIGRLANLKSLRVGPCTVGMAMFVDQDVISCAPELLERLDISPSSCIFSRLPMWIGGLQKLRILKIAVRVLLSSDIDTITGLPVLAVLSLYVQKPNAESVVFNSGSLPALKHFKYRCAALRLAFEKEALPNLQRLKLCFNVHSAESFTSKLDGIENLLKLKEITAEIGAAAGAHESDRRAAESTLKEATRKHPRFPIHMNLKSVDCIEEESTAAGFMHRIPYILGFLALAVVVVVLIKLFWY